LEDLEFRHQLLRCGWGLVREMNWFLDSLLGYVMIDVVDVEWARLKNFLGGEKVTTLENSQSSNTQPATGGGEPNPAGGHSHLDFTTLRTIHSNYLERVLTGSLLSNHALTSVIRSILKVCERFAAHMERWGGDVLPELLFEGSLGNSDERVGDLVRERLAVVSEINDVSDSPEAGRIARQLATDVHPTDVTNTVGSVLRATIIIHISTAVHSYRRCVQICADEYEHGKHFWVPYIYPTEAQQRDGR
jgi:Gamma tubulin complex component C-terminal